MILDLFPRLLYERLICILNGFSLGFEWSVVGSFQRLTRSRDTCPIPTRITLLIDLAIEHCDLCSDVAHLGVAVISSLRRRSACGISGRRQCGRKVSGRSGRRDPTRSTRLLVGGPRQGNSPPRRIGVMISDLAHGPPARLNQSTVGRYQSFGRSCVAIKPCLRRSRLFRGLKIASCMERSLACLALPLVRSAT